MASWAFISLFFFPATMAKESTTMHRQLDVSRCDESKCLSSGPEAIVNRTGQIGAGTLEEGLFESSYDLHRFDCYYKPNSNDALLCAEGYTGYPIDTSVEPSRVIASPLFFFGAPVEQNYYTCCPTVSDADLETASEPIRRCGDPLKVASGSDDPMPCNGDDGRIYSRPMQTSMPFYPDTYMCCDEDLESATEEEEKEEAEIVVPQVFDASGCDESRCLGRSVGEFLPGYSCWGEGPDNLNPYACSDGYVGVEVEDQHDQPPFFDEGQYLKYYTCCPPSVAADIKVAPRRHCSEPIDYEPSEDEIVCADPTLQYPRKQNKNGHYWHSLRNPGITSESYVCCDVKLETEVELEEEPQSNVEEGNPLAISGASESFLDEVNCVMTCDPDFIFDCWANNKYGFLWPMGCDDPNGVFVEPILLGQGYAMAGTRFFHKYGCCKKGFGTGPFIQDKAFNQTVWPQLILSILAVFSSVLLIAALMTSFFYGDTEGAANVPTTKLNASAISSTASEGRGSGSGMISSLKRSIFRSRTSQDSRSSSASRKKGKGNANSAYNAYLVYLAIPDLILNLFVVILYGGYVNQKFYPGFSTYIVNSIFYERKTAYDMALVLACSAANLYLNAIISYELFTLLKNSKRRLRTPPPTFRRVGLQAVCVYAWSICIFLIRFFVEDSSKIPAWLEITLYFMISAGIPILYLCYVCFVIWRRELLPSMKGPLRVLALYFFRIIAVFILLWLPGCLLLSFAINWDWDNAGDVDYNDTLYPIGLIFCSIQPIFSTGMALTKPDVRAAFSRFLRFSYCRQEQQMEEDGGAGDNKGIKGDIEVPGKAPVSQTGMAKTSITNSSVINSSVE